MPIKNACWKFADTIQTKDNQDLAYIMFHYCGEDGDYHDVYMKNNVN